MLKKLSAMFGLWLVTQGIRLYEGMEWAWLDFEDKENLKKLWDYYDYFKKELETV